MEPKFINRKRELDFLENNHQKEGKNLLILYGRRRIGKTQLINQFSKDKDHLYFLADKRGTYSNAKRFVELFSKQINDFTPEIDNFYKAFEYVVNRARDKKFIITIDEFSYLVEKDETIPSVFQVIIDQVMDNSNITLILCGSSISMMEKGTLSYQSPLYGRRTGQWKLDRFHIKNALRFLPNKTMKEKIELLSIYGEIPAYLNKFNNKDVFTNIKENMLTKGEFLYDEGRNLLIQELKDPTTYFNILEAMTKSSKPGEIATKAGIDGKDLPKYMKNLLTLDLIKKENPITEKKPKKSLYHIKDSYLKFWFRYVFNNESMLEEGKVKDVLRIIKNDFNIFVSDYFEHFCRELVKSGIIEEVNVQEIGREWGRMKGPKDKNTFEIDIVSIDKNNKKIIFGECKWKDNVDAEKILEELKEKSQHIEFNKDKRKEHYAIFAKSFKKRSKEGYNFDLKDIEKFLK